MHVELRRTPSPPHSSNGGDTGDERRASHEQTPATQPDTQSRGPHSSRPHPPLSTTVSAGSMRLSFGIDQILHSSSSSTQRPHAPRARQSSGGSEQASKCQAVSSSYSSSSPSSSGDVMEVPEDTTLELGEDCREGGWKTDTYNGTNETESFSYKRYNEDDAQRIPSNSSQNGSATGSSASPGHLLTSHPFSVSLLTASGTEAHTLKTSYTDSSLTTSNAASAASFPVGSLTSSLTTSSLSLSSTGGVSLSSTYLSSYANALVARLRSENSKPAWGHFLPSFSNIGYRNVGTGHLASEHPLVHWPATQRDRFGVVRRVGHPYQNRAPPKRKKPRTSFSRAQIVELEKRFHRQKYLASAERSSLAKQLKMTDAQVKTWFQNRRTKWRRQTAEEREMERQSAQKFLMSLRSGTEEEGPIYTQMCIPPTTPMPVCLPVSEEHEST